MQSKVMRRAGGWSIALGIVTLSVGLCVGVGCIITGGDLLKNSH